jgi:glycosyltransferase involved in cell wall biosynthesis
MYAILISVLFYDKILILGSTGGLILPFLFPFRSKFVLNIGGIEWQRSKYSPIMQKISRFLMKVTVKFSGHLIADNQGIKDYIKEEYRRTDPEVIAYGGDQAVFMPVAKEAINLYPFLKGKYAIAIARIQSDNNVEMLLEVFKEASFPLVYIGNWDVSEYARNIREKYINCENLILLDAIYDLQILNILRSNCYVYVHGHSAGGTNPSLVEAMHCEIPIACYGNIFNKYVTEHKALYFLNKEELSEIIRTTKEDVLKENASKMKEIAMNKYTWEIISHLYYNFLISC